MGKKYFKFLVTSVCILLLHINTLYAQCNFTTAQVAFSNVNTTCGTDVKISIPTILAQSCGTIQLIVYNGSQSSGSTFGSYDITANMLSTGEYTVPSMPGGSYTFQFNKTAANGGALNIPYTITNSYRRVGLTFIVAKNTCPLEEADPNNLSTYAGTNMNELKCSVTVTATNGVAPFTYTWTPQVGVPQTITTSARTHVFYDEPNMSGTLSITDSCGASQLSTPTLPPPQMFKLGTGFDNFGIANGITPYITCENGNCVPTFYLNYSKPSLINAFNYSAHTQNFQYRIDGGPWILFNTGTGYIPTTYGTHLIEIRFNYFCYLIQDSKQFTITAHRDILVDTD